VKSVVGLRNNTLEIQESHERNNTYIFGVFGSLSIKPKRPRLGNIARSHGKDYARDRTDERGYQSVVFEFGVAISVFDLERKNLEEQT